MRVATFTGGVLDGSVTVRQYTSVKYIEQSFGMYPSPSSPKYEPTNEGRWRGCEKISRVR